MAHDEVLQSAFTAAFGQARIQEYQASLHSSQQSNKYSNEVGKKAMTRCIRLTVARTKKEPCEQTKHARTESVIQLVSQGNQEQRENASAMRA